MASVAHAWVTLDTPPQGLRGRHWLLSIDAMAAESAESTAEAMRYIKHRFDERVSSSYYLILSLLTISYYLILSYLISYYYSSS